ncbi:MAG: LPS export ABC transporter periplasmic protein LptC [Opitutae bacterium]|nr:LPS export ABC transporter periplasmic protein LptC [Opitutae bacterium]
MRAPVPRAQARCPQWAALLVAFLGIAGSICAQTTTRIATDAPIVNFRLPTFTPEGYRQWLVRGTEARLISTKEIDIRELTLTVFTADATDRIETMILSPSAKVLTDSQVVSGPGTIRVIRDDLDATGANWTYDHKEKRVSMRQNVRVTFRAELKNFLQ